MNPTAKNSDLTTSTRSNSPTRSSSEQTKDVYTEVFDRGLLAWACIEGWNNNPELVEWADRDHERKAGSGLKRLPIDKQIRRYFRESKPLDDNPLMGFKEVMYKQKMLGGLPFGRRYSHGVLSLVDMTRPIRQLITKGLYVDVDMACCHPCIMSNWCEKKGIESPHVDAYVANREPTLKKVMKALDCSRETAKRLFNGMSYGLGLTSIAREFQNKKLPPSITAYHGDIARIMKAVANNHPDLLTIVEKEKKARGSKGSPHASLMSRVFQDIENQILIVMEEYFGQDENISLGYDGLLSTMINATSVDLSACVDEILERTGYEMRLEFKGFDDFQWGELPDDDEKLRCVKALEKMLEEDGDDEDDDEDVHAYETSYHDWKTRMETKFNMSFIESRGKFHILNSHNDGFKLLTEEGLKTRFRPDKFMDEDENGKIKEKSCIMTWLNDPNRKTYHHMDFCPNGAGRKILNTFKGFEASLKGDASRGSADKFLAHMEYLLEPECLAYAIKWIAHIFQKPHHKIGVAWVLSGEGEGTGKGFLACMISDLIGRKYATPELSGTENNIFGRFASPTRDRLFVQYDEPDTKALVHHAETLKNMITCNTLRVEEKGSMEFDQSDYCRIMFISNKPMVVKVTKADRRYFISEVDAEPRDKRTYYDPLGVYWGTEDEPNVDNRRAVYEYFMGVDLDGWNPIATRPTGRLHEAMLEANNPLENLFLSYLQHDIIPTRGDSDVGCSEFPGRLIYSFFREWCKEYMGISDANIWTNTHFGTKFGLLKDVRKKKTRSTIQYTVTAYRHVFYESNGLTQVRCMVNGDCSCKL